MEDEKRKYPYDLIGGEFIEPVVVLRSHNITGTHKGTVYVESGRLCIEGSHDGVVNLKQNSEAEVRGVQNGTVNIEYGATLTVSGTLEGTVNVYRGGLFTLEEGGKLSGTVFNEGTFCLRGILGGFVNGDGEFKVEEPGQIKQPVIRNKIKYFEW
jgi:hypothetical protein